MKRLAPALALLALGGCGSVYNLAAGPQLYGGVRHDLHVAWNCCKGGVMLLDVPFSAVLDTGLLPVTAAVEGLRGATGWPPREVE